MEQPTGHARIVRFGVFEVDLRSGELHKQGLKIRLQEQPFEILAMLLEHPGDVVTREELQKKLWHGETFVDFEHGLNKAINKIREALGDSADTPRFVETLPRRGYRFVYPVQGPPVAAVYDRRPDSAPAGRRYRKVALAGAGVIAAAVFAYWLTPPLPPPRITRIVQLTSTGRQKQVGSGPDGRLATDGLRVYFSDVVAGRGVLHQVSVGGGEAAPVPTPADSVLVWDISPDGSELLVNTHSGPEFEVPLRIMPTLGGSPRAVGNLLANDATWTPDGRRVVYTNGNDLFLAASDGSESRKLVTASGRTSWPRWSPDGTRLRFTVYDFQQPASMLWEVTADGANLHRVLPGWNNPSKWECCGNWTADGNYFVFQAFQNGRWNLWAICEKASLFRKTGRDPVQLTDGPMLFWSPIPSKDGKRLFAAGTQRRGELTRYDAKRQHFVPCLSGISAEFVAFSRDGAWVSYVTFPEGCLWRSKPDGRERVQLTFPPMQVVVPRWSPDGKRIAFTGATRDQLAKIYLVSAEGGALQQLIPGEGEAADPQWSPDGNRLLFGSWLTAFVVGRSEPVALHLLDLRTIQISTVPGSEGLRAPRWSPDGRYVAAQGSNAENLMLFDFKTRKWEELDRAPIFDHDWSKDGKYVYYWTIHDGVPGVFRVRIHDHKVELVASLEQFTTTGVVGGWLGLALDDSPLLLRDTSIEEIYALDWEAP